MEESPDISPEPTPPNVAPPATLSSTLPTPHPGMLLWVGLGIVLVALGGGAWWFSQSRQTPTAGIISTTNQTTNTKVQTYTLNQSIPLPLGYSLTITGVTPEFYPAGIQSGLSAASRVQEGKTYVLIHGTLTNGGTSGAFDANREPVDGPRYYLKQKAIDGDNGFSLITDQGIASEESLGLNDLTGYGSEKSGATISVEEATGNTFGPLDPGTTQRGLMIFAVKQGAKLQTLRYRETDSKTSHEVYGSDHPAVAFDVALF